jgi:hypothetical protein
VKYQELTRWKYRLARTETFITGWALPEDIHAPFIKLFKDGHLEVFEGYCWDGPSGPTIDRATNMRGSLAHDALYQLMRMGLLGQEYRLKADELLARLWIEDGMWPWVAHSEAAIVSRYGASNAARNVTAEPPILEAP